MGIRRAEANEPGSLGDMYKVRNKDEAGRLCAVCALQPPARPSRRRPRPRPEIYRPRRSNLIVSRVV